MTSTPAMRGDKALERDKDRPIIVHCIALLIQARVHCSDNDAIRAAWDVFDYLGKPERLSSLKLGVLPEMCPFIGGSP